MKKKLLTMACILSAFLPTFAQEASKAEKNMNRIELCQKNCTVLFGREALTGQGADPEMMDILQKFIFGEVFRTGELDIKTREMITCITLATMQTFLQLKTHAESAVNVGVTSVELREVIYLCAPFIGFPKTLNAFAVINEVFKERNIAIPLNKQGTVTKENRHEKGATIQNLLYAGGISSTMKDIPGDMGADAEHFLTEYCFGDIYTRDGLDLKMRELLTYCILTTLEAESQLHSHYQGNLIAGNNKEYLITISKSR